MLLEMSHAGVRGGMRVGDSNDSIAQATGRVEMRRALMGATQRLGLQRRRTTRFGKAVEADSKFQNRRDLVGAKRRPLQALVSRLRLS